jgi:CRISPR-associated protein Cmr4
MYQSKSYLIHCQTNLHAGSGDTNYGIIDKMVQRDPVTELPSIYPSSLKGAFREYFEEGPDKATLASLAESIFGNKVMKQENEGTDNSKGNTIFHEAQLIGLPMRSNKQPFFVATNKVVLQNWLKKAGLFGINYTALNAEIEALTEISEGSPKILGNPITALMIEDFENVGNINTPCTELKKYLGDNILLMHYDDFYEVCSDYNLPVIARNNLENGESKNLWYEQIIPHQSRFVFFTVSIVEDDFSAKIHEKTIQIGANSSLGYGYCKITKI